MNPRLSDTPCRLVTDEGDVTVESTREFLRTCMKEFHDFVTRVRSVLPKD